VLIAVVMAFGALTTTSEMTVFRASGVSLYRLMNLIDSTKATADRPEIVTSIPSDGRRRQQPMAPPDPRLQKLPRP